MGPIGSAVLTFNGYKQTNKQTDKQSINIDYAFGALRVHLLFQLLIVALSVSIFADFINFFRAFSKFYENRKTYKNKFLKFWSFINLPTRDPTKILGLIGSAVLTFIGYKQTDKQSIYIDIWELACKK